MLSVSSPCSASSQPGGFRFQRHGLVHPANPLAPGFLTLVSVRLALAVELVLFVSRPGMLMVVAGLLPLCVMMVFVLPLSILLSRIMCLVAISYIPPLLHPTLHRRLFIHAAVLSSASAQMDAT